MRRGVGDQDEEDCAKGGGEEDEEARGHADQEAAEPAEVAEGKTEDAPAAALRVAGVAGIEVECGMRLE